MHAHKINHPSETMTNLIQDAIKDRRSVLHFEKTPVEEEKLQVILEAGQWAPSWLNKQPWRFIVVKDPAIKETISHFAPTIYTRGIEEAPVCIVVSVDPDEDPFHFIEDGAAATQNMTLAAHSLGLGSSWIGVFSLKGEKDSAEEKIKNALEIPKTHRVISLMPIGVPRLVERARAVKKNRKTLSKLVYQNKFGKPM
jgi:nitroreductase